MMRFFRVPETGELPVSAGLLALRVVVAGSLLIKHGFEKVLHFSAMAQHFPDPIHIGVVPSLVCAMVGDFVCSILLIFGLATRWAALISFINILVAWAFVHHFAFFGKPGEHGELIVLYLGVMLALMLAGPGRYSVDWVLGRRRV
jgi:putative oxidoreductase